MAWLLSISEAVAFWCFNATKRRKPQEGGFLVYLWRQKRYQDIGDFFSAILTESVLFFNRLLEAGPESSDKRFQDLDQCRT